MTGTLAIGSGPGRTPRRPPARLPAYAVVSAVSFACYILGRVLPEGAAAALVTAVGLGACGWAWLTARALFDPIPRDDRWAPLVAGTVAVAGAATALLPDGSVAARVVGNVYTLSGSAALMLTLVEPYLRWRPDLPRAEKRFRFAFTSVYAGLVAVSVLGLWTEGEGPGGPLHEDLIESGSAVVALLGLPIALRFRARHPLAATRPKRRAATAADRALAARLAHIVTTEELAARPDLRIGDVAARLREPEHRVSQAVVAALGFANFNRWINHHRIARARDMLADPHERRSILEIAYACGFASLGPFNRAFRDETGTTPRAFRAAQRSLRPGEDRDGPD